jgi:TRAP-type transport system periplasmic protein
MIACKVRRPGVRKRDNDDQREDAMPAKMSRRTIGRGLAAAGAAVAAPAILTWPADAAEFSYKYANNAPASWPMNTRAVEAAAKIKEETNGRLDISIFPNNQLGGDTDMLSQLRTGAIEFFTLSGVILSTLVPVASISGVGFAFENYDKVWEAMDGDLGNHVRAQIARLGLVAMDNMLDNGYRHVTTSTGPIRTPDALKGFKIRVQVSPLAMSLFNSFGASPTGINWSDVYPALQTKIVDGQENPLSIIEASKIYEVQKYCSLTGHSWDGFHFLANWRAWQALPPDLRDIARKNFNALALAQRADMGVANNAARAKLEGLGLAFNDVSRDDFRAVLRKSGFYSTWSAKYGDEAWGLLEKVSGALV